GLGFAMESPLFFIIMLLGLLGIGFQWLAWKYSMPAIVIMSIAGLLVGPILGVMNPEESFGALYDLTISIAVAILLFEGSLHLSVKELRGLGRPVVQISPIGAVIAWILGSVAPHFIPGVAWEGVYVIGGLYM